MLALVYCCQPAVCCDGWLVGIAVWLFVAAEFVAVGGLAGGGAAVSFVGLTEVQLASIKRERTNTFISSLTFNITNLSQKASHFTRYHSLILRTSENLPWFLVVKEKMNPHFSLEGGMGIWL
jgi:hypothetical protein